MNRLVWRGAMVDEIEINFLFDDDFGGFRVEVAELMGCFVIRL
jgi:hypothetical protein